MPVPTAWRSIGLDGEPWPDWVRDLRRARGVYAVRAGGQVVYVGSSRRGRLYSTITRHFQEWTDAYGTAGWQGERDGSEVRVWLVDGSGRDVERRVLELEREQIRKLKPTGNVAAVDLDGYAYATPEAPPDDNGDGWGLEEIDFAW